MHVSRGTNRSAGSGGSATARAAPSGTCSTVTPRRGCTVFASRYPTPTGPILCAKPSAWAPSAAAGNRPQQRARVNSTPTRPRGFYTGAVRACLPGHGYSMYWGDYAKKAFFKRAASTWALWCRGRISCRCSMKAGRYWRGSRWWCEGIEGNPVNPEILSEKSFPPCARAFRPQIQWRGKP